MDLGDTSSVYWPYEPQSSGPMRHAQSAIDKSDTLSRQNAVLRKLVTLLARRSGINNCLFTKFELDMANERGTTIEVGDSGNAILRVES